ncbi:tyrosine-type recombinase/integrase [Frigidibacter sp. MR17.24]|uniref:tyrosine-type recombinase/integrase n=1 Tax=Frigidibacter sp. MR17.24 TaxID=3127345 RepID=UPI00301314E8
MRLKHIKTIRKPSGLVLRYLAVPGKKLVRLPDSPLDSPEFLDAYARAMRDAKPAQKGRPVASGSIAAAIIAYQKSDAFLALSKATRDDRRRILSKIADLWGETRLADLRPDHVEGDLSVLAPFASNNRLKAWRGLTKWCKAKGLCQLDAGLNAERRTMPKTDGHVVWTAADVEAFRRHWAIETAQRLAMELIYWTAARSSDAVRLGPGMVDYKGWLVFRQQKTGGEVAVPFDRALPPFAADSAHDLDRLKACIDAAPRHMTWIITERGAARSVKAFSQWFAAAARKAGVSEKTAHGLRKARATYLAEAGATTHQIAAWTGHDTLSEVERYSKAAERRRLLSGPEEEQKLETEARRLPKIGK